MTVEWPEGEPRGGAGRWMITDAAATPKAGAGIAQSEPGTECNAMRGSVILVSVVVLAIVASFFGGGAAAQGENASPGATADEGVREALRLYIQGINEADRAKLERALHPDWRMFGLMDNGEMVSWARERFVETWGKKHEGMAPGRGFTGTILSVDITGDAAVGRVRLENERIVYTDYLSLLRTPEGWRIMNKVWNTVRKPA